MKQLPRSSVITALVVVVLALLAFALRDAFCAGESRHRLIVAGAVLLMALAGMVTIVVVARRDP